MEPALPRRPRRRRPLRGPVLGVLAFALGASTTGRAVAQTSAALAVEPAPPGDAALLVSAPDARGSGLLRARLLFDHASEPLVLIGASGRAHAVVERQSSVHALLSYALLHRVLIY